MNTRQLAQVGLGLLGVWSLLAAVETFVQIAGLVGASIVRVGLSEAVPVALLLGLSYLLIFHNAQAAAAIFPDIDNGGGSAHPDLARTLIALLGVLLLIQATPTVVNVALSYFFVGDVGLDVRRQMIPRFVSSLIPIAAGLYLIRRPEWLLAYLERPLVVVAADAE